MEVTLSQCLYACPRTTYIFVSCVPFVSFFGGGGGIGGALHLAMESTFPWAALALVAPALPDRSLADLATGLRTSPLPTRVFILQGTDDEWVPHTTIQVWVETLRSMGDIPLTYDEIENADHSLIISNSPENMKKIFDFFFF